jgi:hypothetical protein
MVNSPSNPSGGAQTNFLRNIRTWLVDRVRGRNRRSDQVQGRSGAAQPAMDQVPEGNPPPPDYRRSDQVQGRSDTAQPAMDQVPEGNSPPPDFSSEPREGERTLKEGPGVGERRAIARAEVEAGRRRSQESDRSDPDFDGWGRR